MDKLINYFKNLQKNAEKLTDSSMHIEFSELFPTTFMNRYTSFNSIEDFMASSNLDFTDADSIPEEELNTFVNKNTKFSDWDNMIGTATEIWIANKLGL